MLTEPYKAMKLKLLIIVFIFSIPVIYGQEIKLKSAITASVGISTDKSTDNLSKWRLGQVHSIILKSEDINDLPESNWKVKPYANPFERYLNLGFKTESESDFIIQV